MDVGDGIDMMCGMPGAGYYYSYGDYSFGDYAHGNYHRNGSYYYGGEEDFGNLTSSYEAMEYLANVSSAMDRLDDALADVSDLMGGMDPGVMGAMGGVQGDDGMDIEAFDELFGLLDMTGGGSGHGSEHGMRAMMRHMMACMCSEHVQNFMSMDAGEAAGGVAAGGEMAADAEPDADTYMYPIFCAEPVCHDYLESIYHMQLSLAADMVPGPTVVSDAAPHQAPADVAASARSAVECTCQFTPLMTAMTEAVEGAHHMEDEAEDEANHEGGDGGGEPEPPPGMAAIDAALGVNAVAFCNSQQCRATAPLLSSLSMMSAMSDEAMGDASTTAAASSSATSAADPTAGHQTAEEACADIPEPSGGETVTFTATVEGSDPSAFDTHGYKQSLASYLSGVSEEMIDVEVVLGSLIVTSTVVTPSASVAVGVSMALTSLAEDPKMASSILGVPVSLPASNGAFMGSTALSLSLS